MPKNKPFLPLWHQNIEFLISQELILLKNDDDSNN